MPPLSCGDVTKDQTVNTIANGTAMNHSTTDSMKDLCDKAEDEYVKKATSDEVNSTTEEQVPLRIVWRNVILFGLLHLASLYAIYLMFSSAKWQTNIFATILYIMSGLGVTAGVHRLWAHRSYKARLPLRLFLAFIYTIAFENDIYEWCRDHRVHHKYSETDADPHNAKRGFFFSHIGWLLCRKHPDVIKKGKIVELSDLWADPIVRLHRKSFSNIMLSGSKASHIFSESVAIAAQRGMEECRYQFQWDRWDCPKSSFNVFSKSTSHSATKEMSFLHAILSAAIVITLTRNCSLGHFDTCGCDKTKKGIAGYDEWSWGGCSDNVLIGNKMAKEFLDSKESGRDAKALINLHNNKVGRVLVRKNMRRLCKCHGVSGSCATQTCWMRMQDLREVADNLKASYKSAILVEYNDGHGSLMPSRYGRKERNRNAISQPRLRIPRSQLIYMEHSPNYCIRNLTAGIPGTSHRECSRRKGKNIPEAERMSCRTLCRSCGRKVKKSTVIVRSSCKCKFHWCCDVKCEECIEEVTKFYCT